MKYDTFQEQFELLDDVPCMAATLEFLLEAELFGGDSIERTPYFGNALECGFNWVEKDYGSFDYWPEQNKILIERLNNNK